MPSGTDGYADLARNARVVTVEGIGTPLPDLADVVRSKPAATARKTSLCYRPSKKPSAEEGIFPGKPRTQ
jgi:hypothetical protein